MKKLSTLSGTLLAILFFLSMGSVASATMIDFEDLAEGNVGIPFTHMGVTFHELNNVAGVFPDGSTFEPQEGHECIVETATYFWDDFPDWGSPVNVLTFGNSYIGGDNFTIGALATVTMDFAEPASDISLDLGFYEGGPWGDIVYHLDALQGGSVVGSDTYTLISGGDRDVPGAITMSVPGVVFDQLHLYATFGDEYSMPRGMIDNITFETTVSVEESTLSAVKKLFE